MSQCDSRFSACALQIASPTIHPVLQTIHTIDSTLTDLCEVRLAQISSTRSFTTPAKNKKTVLWVGIYRLLPVNSPLGSSPEWIPDRFATRLSCWPAVPAATLTWSLLTLAIQPHPGCKSLAREKKKKKRTSLECLLTCQMVVCKSARGPNLISVRHLSVLSEMKLRLWSSLLVQE